MRYQTQEEVVEDIDTTTERGANVEEAPWVSPAVEAAQAGRKVDFSMNVDETLSDPEE